MTTKKTRTLAQAMATGTVQNAFKAYTTHLRRAERIEHPDGITDNGGRWYPRGLDATVEMGVRSPSREYPWSYMLRCRTLAHCELMLDADHDVVLALKGFMKDKDMDPLKTSLTTVVEAIQEVAFFDAFKKAPVQAPTPSRPRL